MGGQTLLTITIFSVDGKLSNVAATQEGPGNGSSYYQLISPKGENIIFKSTGLGNGPSWWFSYLNVGASSFFVLLLSPNGSTGDFTGKVVGVLGGDTLVVLHNQHPERIRLSRIDCPEKGQAYGKRAKQAASELVYGKEVTLQTFGKDK